MTTPAPSCRIKKINFDELFNIWHFYLVEWFDSLNGVIWSPISNEVDGCWLDILDEIGDEGNGLD